MQISGDILATTVHQLEQTVLELGVEVYRLKSEIGKIQEANEQFVRMVKGLKAIMDEKGIIEADDFEAAVDIASAVAAATPVGDSGMERLKKANH